MMQEIECEGCHRVFTREAQRGRKPTRCPECKGEGSGFVNPFGEIPANPFGPGYPYVAPAGESKPERKERQAQIVKAFRPAGEQRKPFPSGIVRPSDIVPARLGIHYRVMWGESLYAPALYTERADAFTEARNRQAEELPRHEGGAVYRVAKVEILSLEDE